MGLFSKTSSHKHKTAQMTISSIIGQGMVITGDLTFSGKLKLEGDINGNIQGEHLVIGKTGVITGDVHTESCTCQGKIFGNIKSKDLTVIKGCRIEGNVETVNFAVESGASLIGEVKVDDKDLRLLKTDSKREETLQTAIGES